jgi:thioredoxin 1
MAASNIVNLTETNFANEVLNSPVPVLVDFWAEWCGPCKMIMPTINEIASDYAGKVKVGKVNVDNNGDVAGKYMIRSIPSLLIFNKGKLIDQIVGVVSKTEIISRLEPLLHA